jgi:hypothetical protein
MERSSDLVGYLEPSRLSPILPNPVFEECPLPLGDGDPYWALTASAPGFGGSPPGEDRQGMQSPCSLPVQRKSFGKVKMGQRGDVLVDFKLEPKSAGL